MLTSMHTFLWFFVIGLILILLGICYEEKLIRFENTVLRICAAIVKTLHETMAEKRYQKAIRIAYKGYQSEQRAKSLK